MRLAYLALILTLVFSVQSFSPAIADASCAKQTGGNGSVIVRATATNGGSTFGAEFQIPNGYRAGITCLDTSSLIPMPNASIPKAAIEIRKINSDGKSWTSMYWRSFDGSQEYPGPINALRLPPGNYDFYVYVFSKPGSFAEITVSW